MLIPQYKINEWTWQCRWLCNSRVTWWLHCGWSTNRTNCQYHMLNWDETKSNVQQKLNRIGNFVFFLFPSFAQQHTSLVQLASTPPIYTLDWIDRVGKFIEILSSWGQYYSLWHSGTSSINSAVLSGQNKASKDNLLRPVLEYSLTLRMLCRQ